VWRILLRHLHNFCIQSVLLKRVCNYFGCREAVAVRVATLSGGLGIRWMGVCVRYANVVYEVIGRSCESEKPNFSRFPAFPSKPRRIPASLPRSYFLRALFSKRIASPASRA